MPPKLRLRFKRKIKRLVKDLKAGRPPSRGLRIEPFERLEGVYEFHWARNGRALFRYGVSPHAGDVHVIWLRIGTHEVYEDR